MLLNFTHFCLNIVCRSYCWLFISSFFQPRCWIYWLNSGDRIYKQIILCIFWSLVSGIISGTCIHKQVYYWICYQLWWHCANGQPSTEAFLVYAASMRHLWLYYWEIYNCTLAKPHQMKVNRMFSVTKYIYFSQISVSLDLRMLIFLLPTD